LEFFLVVIGRESEGNIIYLYRQATEAHFAKSCKLLPTLAISENHSLHDEKKVIPFFYVHIMVAQKTTTSQNFWGDFLRMKILKDKDPDLL
jgi:hypothetical protein